MSELPVWEVSDGDVDEAEVPMVAEEVEEVEQRPTCYCMSASSAMRLLAVLGLVVIVGSVIVASMLPNSPGLLSSRALWPAIRPRLTGRSVGMASGILGPAVGTEALAVGPSNAGCLCGVGASWLPHHSPQRDVRLPFQIWSGMDRRHVWLE